MEEGRELSGTVDDPPMTTSGEPAALVVALTTVPAIVTAGDPGARVWVPITTSVVTLGLVDAEPKGMVLLPMTTAAPPLARLTGVPPMVAAGAPCRRVVLPATS
jgi:hypothetical protein